MPTAHTAAIHPGVDAILQQRTVMSQMIKNSGGQKSFEPLPILTGLTLHFQQYFIYLYLYMHLPPQKKLVAKKFKTLIF